MKKEITYEELMAFIKEKNEESNRLYEERKAYLQKHHMLPADTVLDEEKSVRWNREEVLRRNNECREMVSSFAEKFGQCEQEIRKEIITYIQSEYALSETMANVVYSAAYEDGHSAGYEEVISFIADYANFAERIIHAYQQSLQEGAQK